MSKSHSRTIAAAELLEPRLVLDAAAYHACFDPDMILDAGSNPSSLEASNEPGFAPFQFDGGDRWDTTATNGSGLTLGQPTTLTWGLPADGSVTNNGATSSLISFLNTNFGSSGATLADRPWFTIFDTAFERLEALSGLTYTYEPNDDGAAMGTAGLTGVRADIRIMGRNIDGSSGTLAFNFFPNHGDMVIDTADVSFYTENVGGTHLGFRNVLMHEAGHGVGIDHVESSNGDFLMEPFIDTSFDGLQLDDILALQRGYGDAREKSGGNDTFSTATSLGSIPSGATTSIGTNGSTTTVGGSAIDFISIDDESDADFFSFTIAAASTLELTLVPVGPTYLQGPQGGAEASFNAQAQSDLTLQLFDTNGTTVLSTANATGVGGAEIISSFSVGAAGTYFAKITGATTDKIQLYSLDINPVTIVASTDYGDAPTAAQSGFASSYPVTIAQDGARHSSSGPRLGSLRDEETDGQPTATANGDDLASTDDEDGITFLTSIVTSSSASTASVSIDLQNADASSNRLDGWIDFNRDGDWSDAGEQVFTNAILGTTSAVLTRSFTIPANASTGTTFARFRLSTAGGLSVTGAAADGEVEDYQVTILADAVPVAITVPNAGGAISFDFSGGNRRLIQGGNTLFAVPTAATGGLTLNGTDGVNDTLTLSFSGGNPIPTGGLTWNGGAGAVDSLVLTGVGAGFGTQTYNFSNATDGTIVLNNGSNSTINFFGLEPISNDGTAANIIFNLPNSGNVQAILEDDGANGNTFSRLRSSPVSFEQVDFVNPSSSLTINRGSVTDDITINALPDFTASLTIGSAGSLFESATFEGAMTLASGKSLATAATTITLNAAADLAVLGAGNVTLLGENLSTIAFAGGSLDASGSLVSLTTGTSGTITTTSTTGNDVVANVLELTAGTSVGSMANPLRFNATTINASTPSGGPDYFLVEADSVGINNGNLLGMQLADGTLNLLGGTFALLDTDLLSNGLSLNVTGATLDISVNPTSIAGLTFTSASTFAVTVNDIVALGTDYGALNIINNGTIELNGAELLVTGSISTNTGGAPIEILTNDDGDAIVGKFSDSSGNTIDEGDTLFLNGVRFTISYVGGSGNDVTLTLVPSDTDVLVDGSGNLTINGDIDGGSLNDSLTIQSDTTNSKFIITDPTRILRPTVGTAVGEHTIEVPFASVTGSAINVNSLGGNDSLTVDFSKGNFSKAITFNGGAASDLLTVTGGSFATVTHTFASASSGTIAVTDNKTISYLGLEPVIDNLSATNRVFTFTGGAETITLTDAGVGTMMIDSTLGESVTFANPTGSLTINAGTGDDAINLMSVDAAFNAALTINGDADSDTVTQAATLSLAAGNNVSVTADIINISGSITTTGAGTITLDADGGNAGDVTINSALTSASGAIAIRADDDITAGLSGTISTTSGAASLTADDDANASGTILYDGAINHGSSGSTWSLADSDGLSTGVISGPGGVIKNGTGRLMLIGVSTYSGSTLINAGTLASDINTSESTDIGDGSATNALIFNGGTFQMNGFTSPATRPFILQADAVLNDSGANNTIAGVISGAFDFRKTGSGILTLTGANTFGGAANTLQLDGGRVVVDSDARLGNASNTLILNGGVLRSTASFTTTRAVSITDSSGFDASNDSVLTVASLISGTGAMTIQATGGTGSGVVVFSNSGNTQSGLTTVETGTLRVTANNALGATAIGTQVSTGATLDFANVAYTTAEPVQINNGTLSTSTGTSSFAGEVSMNSGTPNVNVAGTQLTLSGTINWDRDWTRDGSGILILSGGSTGVGTHTMTQSAGTTLVSGSTASNNSFLINAGTLGGTGTIAGIVSIASGATIAPTPGAGTSTLATGALTLTAGATYAVDINGTTAGTQHDQLNVTGTVTLGNATFSGTLGYSATNNDQIVLILNDDTDAVSGTFNGLPEGSAVTIGGTKFLLTYLGGTGNDVVLNADTAAPSTLSFTRQTPATASTSADTLVFRATFSESVTAVDTADFAVNGTTTATVTAVTPVSGSVYDITVSGGDLATFNGIVGLNLAGGQNITDLVGTALPTLEPATDETFTVDNTAPSTTSFTRQSPATNPTAADTLVFRATFSETVIAIDTADFAVNGTTTATVTGISGSGNIYDITVSGGNLAGFNGVVGLNFSGTQNITDAAGTALPSTEPTTDETYTLDNSPPSTTSFTRQTPATSPTTSDTLVFRATFSETVIAVDTADFAVNGTTTATVTGISGSGNIYDITVSGGNLAGFNGVVGLNLSGTQNITDSVGAALPSTEPLTDETYTVDNTAPSTTSFTRQTPATSPTTADVLVFRATFSETVLAVDTSDFAVNGTTTATVTAVTPVSGSVYDVTISGGNLASFNGVVGLNLAGGQNITDTAGFALPSTEPATDETYTVDNTAPSTTSFTRQTPATSPTSADTLVFRATFSETVIAIDTADFVVNGTTTATVTLVTPVSGSVYDITVSGGDLAGFNGVVGLNFSGTQNITDGAGTALPSTEPTTDETYTLDNTVPSTTSFVRRTPSGSSTNADTLVFRATFSESVSNVDLADFVVNGTTTATVTAVATVSGSIYDITVSGGDLANFNGVVGIDLAVAQDIADAAGTALPTTEPATDQTFTVDNTTPSVVSFTRRTPATSPTNSNTLIFRVTFNEAVTNVGASDFVVNGTTTATVTLTNPISTTIYDITVAGGDLAGFNGEVGLDFSGTQNITDTAGNPVPSTEPAIDETYTVDNSVPSTLSFTRQTPATSLTSSDTLVFRATFSESVANVTTADFAVSGTTATATLVTAVSGSVYDITVSGGNLASLNGDVGLNLAVAQNITDSAGNLLPTTEPATDETYTLDNTAPSTTSFTRQTPLTSPTSADTLVFRATFNESVANIDTADFAVNGTTTATITAVTSVSGDVYDITVSGGDLASFNGIIGLNFAAGQNITDAAGFPLPSTEPGIDETYTVDNTAPSTTSFTRQTPATSPTTADVLVFRATFSETVLAVDTADFAVNGTTTATVTGISVVSGSVYDVTVSGGNLASFNGVVGLNFVGGQNITDAAGTALPSSEPSTDETYTVDNTAPSTTSFTRQTPATSPTNADTLVFRATFSETVIAVDTADFAVNGTTTATVTAVTPVSGSIYDVTVSGGNLATFNGVVGLNFSGTPTITDGAGTALPSTEPTTDETYTIDNLAPDSAAAKFERLNPLTSPTNADSLVFRATFSESVIAVDTADFAVNGTTTATVTNVTPVSGSVYDITVSGGDLASFNGVVGLNFSGTQNITDAAGNAHPSTEPAIDETYTIDNIAPNSAAAKFERLNPLTSPTNADTLVFRATFSETVIAVDSADFAVNGTTTATVTSVTPVSGSVYEVTISGGNLASFNGVVGLNFSGTQNITDPAGNAQPSTEPAIDETYTVDNTAPTTTSFTRQTPLTSPTDVATLVFRATFSETVTGVDTADFTVNSTTTATVTAVTPISGSVYDVTVSGGDLANFTGVVGLNFSGGQNIVDTVGLALPTTEPAIDETYQHENPMPSVLSFARQTPATSTTNASTLIFRATFSEDVIGVGAADFAVNGATTATVTAVAPVSGSVYDITISGGNLGSFDGLVGLNLAAGQNITDAALNLLPTVEPVIDETYDVDTLAPTVDIIDVTPDPRTTSVASISIVFSEAISGFSKADLTLTRGGVPVALNAAQTLTTVDNITWTLANLQSRTNSSGAYVLTLTAAGSGIADSIGNLLTVSASDNWTAAIVNTGDFGDAPDTYGTMLDSNGPRHAVPGPQLGSTRDPEGDAPATLNGTGDDTTNTGSADDEDGVTVLASIVRFGSSAVTLTSPTGGKLDAWIDLNASGTFDDPTERLGATGLGTAGSVTLAVGTTTIIFDIPASTPLTASTTYGRFRLSTAGSLSPTDVVDAVDGEVEDHLFAIVVAPPSVIVDDSWVSAIPGDVLDGGVFGVNRFDTIAQAVLVVATNGTVTVKPGTYAEAVIIDKSLTLAGQSGIASDVVIDPPGVATNGITITNPATNVSLSNVTIQGAADGINASGAVNLTVTGVSSLTQAGSGLISSSTGDVTINGGTYDGISVSAADDVSLGTASITSTDNVSIAAQNTVMQTGSLNAGDDTVTISANLDGAGSGGFTMSAGTKIETTNNTAAAITVTVNSLAGGTGNASIQQLATGADYATAKGGVTVDANMGAVLDGNAATNNIIATATVLRGQAGVGTTADPIETITAKLEGVGGTGGFFVTNTGNLLIGGIDATAGISTTTGNISVLSEGQLTVSENVGSTNATGNIVLSAVESLSATVFSDLTVNMGVAISSPNGNISLLAGDNVTLQTGTTISAPTGSITVSGDNGDNDVGGSNITVASQFVSGTGISLTGGNDDDNYSITYPTASLNVGTMTITDAGGTADTLIVIGSSSADTMFFTTGAPTTATTEQVTRTTLTGEPIIIPSGLEAVRLSGGDGNDTFTAQPSSLFPVTIDGGNPTYGDPGVPPGDTLLLDTLGKTFALAGNAFLVNSGTATPFKIVTSINIETFLLAPPSAGPAQRYDFNAQTLNADRTAFVQTATQPGYTGVTGNTLYTAALGYGWQEALVEVRGGLNTAADSALVNDGHLYSTGTSSNFPNFKANIGNGWVQATVTFGHPGLAMDGLVIRNGDTNETLATNLATSLGTSSHVTVYALVTDGTLDLRFEDFTNSRMIVISGLDIRPVELFTIGFANAPAVPLDADGVTVDPFTVAIGEPNSLVTVSATRGTIVSADADLKMDGFQVATNGAGTGSIQIRRPSGAGQSVVSLSTATGEDTGSLTIDYAIVNGQFFDFNTNVSATQVGYRGVITTDLYTAAKGFGWLSQPDNFETIPTPTGSQANLFRDGHRSGAPGTFRVNISNGTYEVHVYMGDGADHVVGVSLAANGTSVISKLPLARDTITERTFPVTITNGQLDLTFSSDDDSFNEPHWVVNGLEIYAGAAIVGTIIPTPNIGSVVGNGSTVTAVNATSNLLPGTHVRVSSSLGTITTTDANLSVPGTQVVVGAGGAITFNLQSPNSSGTPTIEWLSADGAAHTTLTNAAFLTFAVPSTRKFDFNTGSDDATMSPTETGFIGVRANHLNPAADGFGWVAPAPETFNFSSTLPAAFAPAALHRDGARGATNTTGQFRIQALPATNYNVLVYVGAYGLNLDNVRVTAEGQPSVTAAATNWDQRTTVAVAGARDLNGDGFISILLEDPSIGGVRATGWAVTGLEIVQLLTAAIVVEQSSAPILTSADLADVLAVAKTIVASGNLTAAQRNDLAAVNVTIADLNGLRALGLTSGTSIVIDDNGAGLGWSLDEDEVVPGQYDLLTAVVHELGHAIGQDHSDDGVMAPVLNPGDRADEIDAFFASDFGDLLG